MKVAQIFSMLCSWTCGTLRTFCEGMSAWRYMFYIRYLSSWHATIMPLLVSQNLRAWDVKLCYCTGVYPTKMRVLLVPCGKMNKISKVKKQFINTICMYIPHTQLLFENITMGHTSRLVAKGCSVCNLVYLQVFHPKVMRQKLFPLTLGQNLIIGIMDYYKIEIIPS